MVSRSLDAGKISMPPTANSISGKTSVWVMPATRLSRSSAVPGTDDACAVNGLGSWRRSAISSSDISASARMVPWMKSVGPSMPIAPIAATWCGVLETPSATVQANAPTRPSSDTCTCAQ